MRETGFKRENGKAVVGALITLILLSVLGFIAWQKFKPAPPPPPVVVVATPVPVTPPPATPEPVVVKATPTPPPTPTPAPVVVATPPPLPSLDLATVVRSPTLWPAQVNLTKPTAFPVFINGRAAGEATVPAGKALRLLRVVGQAVEVDYQNTRQAVPIASTDLMERALVTFRNNGSAVPQAPTPAAVAVAPVATPAATPAPNPNERIKVEIDTDRKRIELDLGPPVSEGDVKKTTEKYVYEIKVQNRSFGDTPVLEMQYLLFIERQKIGEKKDKDKIERVTGTAKIEPLTRKTMMQTAKTSEFELYRRVVSGDYYYANGGRRKVEDTVVGVWVKVFNEGALVTEYTNPSTVVKRGWENKDKEEKKEQ